MQLLTFAAIALALVLGGCAERSEHRIRIVLITVDTLRFDSFAPTSERTDMPFTWSLASGGQNFEHAYAASNQTQPTHASLFTGLHPWQHGVARNGSRLSPDHETVAEILRGKGFSTAAVVASFPLERRFGLAQGFHQFDQEFDRSIGLAYWLDELVEARRFYKLAPAVTPRALALLDEMTGARQFLWVHYFDPHDPYGDTRGLDLSIKHILNLAQSGDRQGAERVEQAHSLYRNDVSSLDIEISRLMDRLLQERQEIETHVVFTADHGESFGERGVLGHGYHLAPEQIHVPLFILSPRLESGTRSDPAGSVDVARTLLSLAGVEREFGAGRDLTAPPPETAVAVGMRQPVQVPYPFTLIDGSIEPLPRLEFFAADEGSYYRGTGAAASAEDPTADHSAGLARARELFASWEAELEQTATAQVSDPDTLEALRALGYVE